MNIEIIANENQRRIIDELKMKINFLEESRSNNDEESTNVNSESDEIKKLKDKAKEFIATSDLKVKKLKEKHVEEITELKIRKLRVEEELSCVVKERERLKESERILVQTFDTLKTYYEKPTGTFQCDSCDFRFKNQAELRDHNQRNHVERYLCNLCSFVTESKMENENHAKTHIPSATYDCEVCGLKGFSKSDKEVHIKKIHKCVECNTMYKDVYEMNRHKENKHRKKFTCQECDFSSLSENMFVTHQRTHEAEKYKCEMCGKMENSDEKLDEHMKLKHAKEIFDDFILAKKKRRNAGRNRNERENVSLKERKENGVCIYWNRGKCDYGKLCRFSHEDAPECRFQERCFRKSSCRFSHSENYQRRSFLGGGAGYRNQY